MTRRRGIIAAAALGLLGACRDGTGMEPPVAMHFQALPAQQDTVVFGQTGYEPGRLPPARTVVSHGSIRVLGYFETPCAGDEVQGTAAREGGTVRIRVEARRGGGSCLTRTDPYVYDGRVHSLESGSYRVVVEHERDARRANGVVLDTMLTLPR